jgi:FkbM family methyltransferase
MTYAVEGEPSYYKMLTANLKQFDKVEALQYFLGEKTQTERLSISAEDGTAQLSSNHNQSVDVKKLDDLVSEKGLKDIKLLKIDTDGFDLKILRGSFEVLKNDKPVLFFEYDAKYIKAQGDDGISIFASLADIGYNKMLYYDNYGKFLISISTRDKRMIEQLYSYITKGEGAFYYYDICIFHDNDDDLAEITIANEMAFFKDDDD